MDRLQPPAEGDGWKWKNKVWLSRLPWPEWLRSYTDNILTHCCLMFHDVFINLDQERNRTSLWIKKSQNLKRQIFENQFKCLPCSAENTFISLCLFVDLQRQRKKNSNMLKDEIYCFTFNAKCLLHVHEYEVLLIFYPVTILDFWWRHFWLYRKLSCTVCLFSLLQSLGLFCSTVLLACWAKPDIMMTL